MDDFDIVVIEDYFLFILLLLAISLPVIWGGLVMIRVWRWWRRKKELACTNRHMSSNVWRSRN